MAKINLKKIIEKNLLSIINDIHNFCQFSFTILNSKGEIVWDEKNKFKGNYNYPIKVNDEIYGWIIGEEKIAIIAEILSLIIKQELDKKALATDTLEKYEEINFLYDISSKISNCITAKEVSDLVIKEAQILFDTDQVSILLFNEQSHCLETISHNVIIPHAIDNILSYIMLSGKAEIINNVNLDPRYIPENNDTIKSLLCAPLTTQQGIIGLVVISNSKAKQYHSHHLKLLTALTSQAASAIKNALLYEELKEYTHTLEHKVEERTNLLQKANEELEKLATIDSLTTIANRRKFDEYLQKEWLRMKRSHTPITLILCDVDCFKLYNDNYGHQKGDECLKTVAQTLKNCVKRPADLVTRYGGEEFALILPNTHCEGALKLAAEIRQNIENLHIPHEFSFVHKYITVSMGVTCLIPTEKDTIERLIETADKALYQAKENGRNQFSFKNYKNN